MVFKLTAHYLKMSFANLKLLSIVAVKKLRRIGFSDKNATKIT